jgi:hypothetical protein
MFGVVIIFGSMGGGRVGGRRPDFWSNGRVLAAPKTTFRRVKNLEALPKKRLFPQFLGRK